MLWEATVWRLWWPEYGAARVWFDDGDDIINFERERECRLNFEKQI